MLNTNTEAPGAGNRDTSNARPMAGGTPQTLWTAVIQPAAQGSSEHMGSLFRTYQPSVTALMRQHRPGLAQGDVEDLYHEFVRVCLHRDFLANVDRAKGRFRHFLWTCVRRFLQDVHERHQRRPEAQVDGQVENGVGDEPGIEIPHPEDAGWMAMDEAWARQVEAIALKAVAIEMHDARRPGAVRECVLARLKGIAKGTLKEDAQLLGIDEASFNNVFYAARNSYRRFLRMELSRQVAAEDLNDELEHLARVLARVRSMERD